MNKKDFEILYWIEYMNYNYPKSISKQIGITEEKAEKKLKEFEKKGLIEIEMRDEEIYGSRLTKKGKNVWDDEKYFKWKEELGY